MSRLGRLFRRVASSVLEIDDTAVPYEQLEILNDFLSKHQFDLSSGNIEKLLRELKKKHLVDSISVIGKDGELVVSSEGNGNQEASLASSLLNYIDAEIATPESVLIKGNNSWFMLFPFNSKTYIIKAQASLSNIELKALAKELESFVSEKNKIALEEKA